MSSTTWRIDRMSCTCGHWLLEATRDGDVYQYAASMGHFRLVGTEPAATMREAQDACRAMVDEWREKVSEKVSEG